MSEHDQPTDTERRPSAVFAAPPPESEPRDPRFSVEFIDRSRDPADDFYDFATGRWARETPTPADKSRWGAFDELSAQNYRVLREILEAAARVGDRASSAAERQVGDFFASALNVARRNGLRFEPLSQDLARIDAIASLEELVRELAALHRSKVDGCFESYVYPDKRHSDVYAFYLDQGGLSLPDRDYYTDPKFETIRTAFRAHLVRSLASLGETPDRASAGAATVFALETALASASRSRTEMRDQERNYHKVPVGEWTASHPEFPWSLYLAEREVAAAPYVIVGQPEFFRALDRELRSRPLAEWKQYLRWQVLRASAPFLHAEAEEQHFDFFQRTLLGQPDPEPDWKRAARVINALLGEALGELYVARAFPPEARARMGELVADLKAVFRDRLAHLEWMSESTRQRALAKFARFTAKIGHPDVFRDYSSVRIARDDYFGNARRASAFEVHRQVVRVGHPVDRTEWGMTPPTVNAYFSPVFNEIVFPAGILQPPFFDVTMDDAVNYGGIGAVIGHEITHGYDDQGRKFGPDGNLEDWWTPEDAREFELRANRVVTEYNSYEPLPGLPLNGALTLGENLADLGGLSIAYEALQRRLAAEPSRRKDRDGFTPEQRFFLSWAQVWRQHCRDPEARRLVVIDPHAPGRFRVRGAVSNMDAFFAAFPIPPESPMWRPKEARVTIW